MTKLSLKRGLLFSCTTVFALMLSSVWAAGPAERPSSKEISEKARGAELDPANSATAEYNGKRFTFTPARQAPGLKMADIENGVIAGAVDNGFSDITLPEGRYQVYVAKINNQWRAYAVQPDGTIIAEAKSVMEDRAQGPGKPKAWRGSGCFWIWLIVIGFNVCW